MGYCQAGSSTVTCTEIDCKEIGANYSETQPGQCLLLTALKDERAILITSTLIYPSLVKFREGILKKTPLGRHFVDYFSEFYEEAKDIVMEDPKLLTDLVWLTTYVSPFLQAMLGERTSFSSEGITPTTLLASEFRPGTYKALNSVMAQFKTKGSKKFVAALNDAEKILSGFVGLSPEQALKKLHTKPPKKGAVSTAIPTMEY